MENMDNNMDDFFKKQFNRFDEPIEDWEKPDAGDWEAIAAQVPVFNKTVFWTLSNIGLMTLSVVFVSSLVYVWMLRKEITVLKKMVEVQQEQIERVEQSVQIIEKKYVEEQQIIENIETEKQQLQEQNQAIISQNVILNTVAKQQNEVIADLSTTFDNLKNSEFSKSIFNKNEVDNNQLNSSFDNNSEQFGREKPMANNGNKNQSNESITDNNNNLLLAKAENKINENVENTTKTITENATNLVVKDEKNVLKELELLPSSRFLAVNQNPTVFQLKSLILNNGDSKKRKRPIIKLPNVDWTDVELGYEHRVQSMEIPSQVDVMELETTTENETKENYIRLHGLTLGVSLHKNWSLQTGVRYSNSDLKFRQEAFSVYSTDNEVILPDGTIAKSLTIEQETPFSKTNNSVQLLFNSNDRLVDNESFKWFSSGEQDQHTIQIPLGVNYEFGKNRFNGFVGIGTQWNNIKLGNITYQLELEDNDNEFRALASDIDNLSEIKNLNYFSAYTTLGLQYQIWNNWSVKASAMYNYHFLKNTTIGEWNNSDYSAAIGVQYRF